MIVARIVASFGLGMINSTVLVVQSEFSPKVNREFSRWRLYFGSTGNLS